jgi:microcystin-dependent protein
MIFQQTTAPVGWTKESSSTYNNAALRFVTGSISTGGSVDFTTAFASQTPTGTVGDTTLTIAQMPLHGHPFRLSIDNGQSSETNGGLIMAGDNQANQSAYTGTPSATVGQQIGGTGGGGSHTHTLVMNAVNLAVKYADCIIAQKD